MLEVGISATSIKLIKKVLVKLGLKHYYLLALNFTHVQILPANRPLYNEITYGHKF